MQGAGGLDLGLENAGFKTLFANELEPQYCQTLRDNKQFSSLNSKSFELWFEVQLKQKCYKRISDFDKELLYNRPQVWRWKVEPFKICKNL